MARILSPQEYYPSQTPMQARALGTQVGAMEREQALKQAQLGGEMKAAGVGTPQEMYYAQAMGRQAEARRKAAMEAVEESKNFFMDIPEMTKAHGVGPTQKWVNDTLASNPIYGKLFKDGIEVQKQGDTIYLNMGVAEESAPVPMLGEDGKVYQGNTVAGEKYRWVTDYSKSPDQRMYAERIPVTEADITEKVKGRRAPSGGASSKLAWDKATSSILMKTQGTTTASGIVISPERQIETEIATRLLNEYRKYDANTAVSKALNEARNIERQIPTYMSTDSEGNPVENKKQIARMGKNKKTGKRVLQFTDGTTLEIN
jgi:hypothetical protein